MINLGLNAGAVVAPAALYMFYKFVDLVRKHSEE